MVRDGSKIGCQARYTYCCLSKGARANFAKSCSSSEKTEWIVSQRLGRVHCAVGLWRKLGRSLCTVAMRANWGPGLSGTSVYLANNLSWHYEIWRDPHVDN